MNAVERSGAYYLAEEIHGGVVHDGHVVGVPANGARHVQHKLGNEKKHRRNLVGHAFGGVEVAGVKGYHHIVFGGVCGVEVVGAHGVAFEADAEHLRLNAVLHPVVAVLENLVERIFEELAVHQSVDGDVLAAVVYPCVHYAGVLLCLAYCLRDGAAALGVLDPEVAYALVGIGE